MPTIPTPLRGALGAVVTAVDTARSLPQKAIELPVLAVSGALQLSLRVQQSYAELTVRGDELLSRIRGVPDDAPAWATFDEAPTPTAVDAPTSVDAPVSADTAGSAATAGLADSRRSADPALSVPQAVAERAADAPDLLNGPSAGLPSRSRRGRSTADPSGTATSVDGVTTTSAAAEAATASASRRARKAAKSSAAKPARSPSSRRTTADTRDTSDTPDAAVGPAEEAATSPAVIGALAEAEDADDVADELAEELDEAEAAEDLAKDLAEEQAYLPTPRTGRLSAFDVVDESADAISTRPVELPPR